MSVNQTKLCFAISTPQMLFHIALYCICYDYYYYNKKKTA